MESDKNPSKSGLLLILFFSLFALRPTWGQTAEKSITIPLYDKHKLQSLKEKFSQEDKHNESIRGLILSKPSSTKFEPTKNSSSLIQIESDGTPLYYTTYATPIGVNLKTEGFYTSNYLDFGLSGKGMKAGVWDAGMALETHQEFDSRINNTDFDSEIDSHATMVTGVIASSGVDERAKGIAFESEVVTNDWKSDRTEVISEIEKGMLISNHSYGIRTDDVPDWYFGAYLSLSKNWDEIMYSAPHYLMVSAAGNAQNSGHNQNPIYGKSSDGFDLLVGFATSKNGLVVTGANTIFDGEGKLTNASVTGYSSFGPTDDGRIKPDISGDGNLIYSTRATSETSYGSSMGTSMAAPGVSGGLLLLQQHHYELFGSFMRAATLKGLALHTAYDVFEPGPDYKLGWGIMNVKQAKEFLDKRDFSTMLIEDSLEQFETLSFKVLANGEEPLKVSLSWTDPAGALSPSGVLNSGVATLINDLDLRIEKNQVQFYPYKLNPIEANAPATKADNVVDPFERIDIENATGEYIITIKHKGNLKNSAQDFSLLISGAQLSACVLRTPSGLEIDKTTEQGCAFTWEHAQETYFEVQYKKYRDTDWTYDYTWKSNYFMGGLELGESYQFKVRSICSENLESDFSEIKSFVFYGENTQLLEQETKENQSTLKPWPNPTTDMIYLGKVVEEETQFRIIDIAGNIQKQGKVSGPISVTELKTGLYILTTTNQNGTKSAKFFKN